MSDPETERREAELIERGRIMGREEALRGLRPTVVEAVRRGAPRTDRRAEDVERERRNRLWLFSDAALSPLDRAELLEEMSPEDRAAAMAKHGITEEMVARALASRPVKETAMTDALSAAARESRAYEARERAEREAKKAAAAQACTLTWEEKFEAMQELVPDASLRMSKPGVWYVHAPERELVTGEGEVRRGVRGTGRTPEEAVNEDWRLYTEEANYVRVQLAEAPVERCRWNGKRWSMVRG